jgi:hypothetical protein
LVEEWEQPEYSKKSVNNKKWNNGVLEY